VAKDLGLHDSTISRATNNKYVQLPCGKIVTFDFFFDSSLPIKEVIQQILSKEEKENILSDNDIVKLLKEKGINLARRTVTKYREDMNIPSSRDRRYE
jgi:RNA polymerase sigma-54 factor